MALGWDEPIQPSLAINVEHCCVSEKYKEKFLALMQTSHKITTQLNQATDQSTTETFDSRNEEFAFSSQKIRIK